MAATFDFTCEQCQKNKAGTYRLPARCSNCGLEGEAVYSKGHQTYEGRHECPSCECDSVHPMEVK